MGITVAKAGTNSCKEWEIQFTVQLWKPEKSNLKKKTVYGQTVAKSGTKI